MTGQVALEAMTDLRDDLILEAAELLGFLDRPASLAATPPRRRNREDSLLRRFFNSGWGVAVICAVVSLSVLGGIVWAGQRPPVGGPGGNETETHTEIHTETAAPLISEEQAMEIASDYWDIKTGDVADNGFTFRIQSMGTTQTPKGEAVYLIALRWVVELEESSHYSTVDMVWVDMMTGEVIVPYEAETQPDHLSCLDGHHVTEWTVEREAACFVNGLRNGTCSVCNGWVTESIDPLPHTYENGYCTVCGMIEGADMRFKITTQHEEDGSVGGRIVRRDGAEGEKIILPNLVYDPGTESMVPVTVLSGELFKYDSQLREIVIPDTVHTIGDNAFDHCVNLQNVKLPSSLKKIGDMAFTACNSFTEINLPAGVTEIGDMAFGYNPGLTEIILPESVIFLGSDVFSNCTRLKKVSLPDGVTSLSRGLFSYCPALTDIRLPSAVTYVGDSAFAGCASLNAIVLPDTVTRMGNHVFNGCSSLSSFTYPPQVTEIGVNHFTDCRSLTEVVISEATTTISYAFWNCTALQSIHLPASVTELSGIAFEGCSHLTTLTVDEDNPVYTAVGNCIIEKSTGTLIAGGAGATIPSDGSVLIIGESAFHSRYTAETLVMPDSVIEIQSKGFSDCPAIQSIVFSSALTDIGSYAFHDCTALKSAELPMSLKTTDFAVFEGCKALTTVRIPASMTTVRDLLFAECTSLSRVDFTGTMQRWKVLTGSMDFGTLEQPFSDFTVYCTDGEVIESMH